MIINTPITTRIPNIISYQITSRLKIIGSIKDAKKAPVENMESAIETLATFIDAKNVIQCNAIMTPDGNRIVITKWTSD